MYGAKHDNLSSICRIHRVERENSHLQAALCLPHMCYDRCVHEHIYIVCVCKCRLIFSMSFQNIPILSSTHLYTLDSH